MAIPASGPLTMTTIQTEFGGSNPISLSEYYAGGGLVPAGTTGTYGAVPSSGTLSIQNFYGTTADTFWVLQSANTGNSGNTIRIMSSTVDSAGNTIAVGYSNYIGGSTNVGLIISVAPAGTVNFARSYDNSNSMQFNCVCTDSSNNIYVSGLTGTSLVTGVFLKYNSSGVIQFVKGLGNINDQLSFRSIIVASSGNIFIAGNKSGLGVISKYSNTGTYAGTWYTGFAFGRAMVADTSGYVYLAGADTSTDGVTFATRVQKINVTPATPVSVWEYSPTYRGGTGIFASNARNIALDSSNNVWFGGWDRDASNYALFKLNGSTGAYISGTSVTDTSGTYRYPGVAIGSSDVPYMAAQDYQRFYSFANPPTSLNWANSLTNSTYTTYNDNASSINATATSVNTAIGGLTNGSSSQTLCVMRERRTGTGLGTFGAWTYATLSTTVTAPYSAGSVTTPGSNLSAYSVVGGQPTISGTDASASITTTLTTL